jgi:DNA-binding MltR family transcriptional regulator
MNSAPKKKELSDEQKTLLTAAVQDFSAFRMALVRESDRGCALFAAAYLDKALRDLLKSCLVKHRKLDEEIFGSQSPLGSFSSRIKLAYYLGKIAPSERKDLDGIRLIRNDFAHHAELLSFEDQSIRDRCGNLTHNWRETETSARTKFNAAVSALMIRLITERITTTPAEEAQEQPMPEHIKEMGRALRAKLDQVDESDADEGASTSLQRAQH